MQKYMLDHGMIAVNFQSGRIESLMDGETELCAGDEALFTLGLRGEDGRELRIHAQEAEGCIEENGTAVYSGFPVDMQVRVTLQACGDRLEWGIAVENHSDLLVEWVEFPGVCLPKLKNNGGIGQMLFPYNEGALVEDALRRAESDFGSDEPEYPSMGKYNVFPNMMFSQFMAYLYQGRGLYMGAHDAARGVKYLDFMPKGEGVSVHQRLYTGVEFGDDWCCGYPLVWEFFDGGWQQAAELYRSFFETALPPRIRPIEENPAVPEWYADAPLIVTYPVRGIHDMDKMDPNRLFPYCNALPMVDEIAARTGCRILVLLMHWEGTAPWAPPYVWPPYGGEEAFFAFRDALHARGHLLGVYCSGFGYTLESNLIAEYKKQDECESRGLMAGMCAGPDGKVAISRICTGQRKGYDICPASAVGQKILDEAYAPLFESGIDYVQILDQNHGGGQYFCYSREHGHPPAPGAWMTENMQKYLASWNEKAPGMLFGCESAAAEPFIGNMLFSDNRYELNYHIGQPVPLYGYLYHRYLRNFMGNQVACPFDPKVDTLRLRLAYSWAAGDSMTLVVSQDGECMANWGTREFGVLPDREAALTLIANLEKTYADGAKRFLYAGRMIKGMDFACSKSDYALEKGGSLEIADVYSTAWETDGEKMQIFVNHTRSDVTCTLADGETITVPALDALMMKL